MIAAISRKKGTQTGFTNDHKTITKTITFGIKNRPCETLPFFSFSSPFSSPFPFPFPVSSFTHPLFLLLFFPVLFPFFLPFLFRFLFRSFSFPFPLPFLFFPFLYYSFPFSLSSLMWILWPRCETSAWKNERKKHLKGPKGSGFFTSPYWKKCTATPAAFH
jgi:hypothetical protein